MKTQRRRATGLCAWGAHDLHAARILCRGLSATEPCTRGPNGGLALACADHDERCCRCRGEAIDRAWAAHPEQAERTLAAIAAVLRSNWERAQTAQHAS